MKATLTLRRPAHWQDFETLCKKLWGEIWNCPTIRKNGRSGNKQHGVDVYGIPAGEMQYYGIQCKGKDEYTNKQYSESEITEEIENAKKFSPPLKAFYLTTTAVKNADIERYVREKNIENIKIGLFSIEIFSWEDIVELLMKTKQLMIGTSTVRIIKLNGAYHLRFRMEVAKLLADLYSLKG